LSRVHYNHASRECRNRARSNVIVSAAHVAPPSKRLAERRISMQYLLMIYTNENAFSKMTQAEQKQGMAAYTAYTAALREAGALKDSNRLQPTATATTVRVANGKSQVLNGPYTEAKEQFGGY